MLLKQTFLALLLCCFSLCALAQDDLLAELLADDETTTVVDNTFRSTRIVNAHSVDFQDPKELQFLISHRFGRINSGAQFFWGMDNAATRLNFEYGVNERLALGLGRSSEEGIIDGYYKLKLVQQTEGFNAFPFTAVLYSNLAYRTYNFPQPDLPYVRGHRFSYTHQLLLARKFSPGFSLQLMPGVLHRNLTQLTAEENTFWYTGAAARVKITNSLHLMAEYFYVFDEFTQDNRDMPLSLGVDIEVGGHVFQLHITNSQGLNERQFLAENEAQWANGDIHFGFNISRVFKVGGKK